MKNATDVSTRAQPADLVSRMSHLRGSGSDATGTCRLPDSPVLRWRRPQIDSGRKDLRNVTRQSGIGSFLLVPACHPARERITQRGVVGGFYRAAPGGRGLV